MKNFFKTLSPKVKQKLVALFFITVNDILGLIAVNTMPDICGIPFIFMLVGFYLLFTKKQLLDFD